ncbi:MAG: ABC transporter ATP-binding protein [Actinobacteria bacterium]|nr:ABC transporter ATP-binding protein [Actinomycetota bacterium]
MRFGGLTAVDDVSLDIPGGAITGLIGPNGAGKTTLFNIITGLQSPTSGSILWNGADITDVAAHRRARLGISRTFQSLQLFGTLSVRDNVALAARRAHGRRRCDTVVADLLERCGVADLAETLAGSLPTGQARLVELARALAADPRMLLLDEPASGQDPAETDRFGDLLRRIAADGVGILLVEHDVPLVMGLCDSIAVLDYGRLLIHADPATVRNDPLVLAAYLGNVEVA